DNLLTSKRGKELALTEREILQAAWYNKTYLTIADDLYLSEGYIKDLAYRLWQQISHILQVKVTKSNFRQMMEKQNFQSSSNATTPEKVINRDNIDQNDNQNEYASTVLIVDDLEEDLKFLSDILKKEGYKTKCINSPSMALRVLEHIMPDLILLDVKMPKIDGYQLCELLKNNRAVADIPIIFLSALDHISDKIKAFEVGGVDYITKPFHPEEVVLRVRSQMMLQSQKKQLLEEIGQHQQTIEILYQSRALLASVLNYSPDGILGIQAVRNPSDGIIQDFAVLIVNPCFVEIFAQQKDNFQIGSHIMSLLEKINSQLPDLLVQVVETGKSIDQVLRINLSINNQRELRFIIAKLGDGCSLIARNII
ncbi:MAG: response regulator, partial [Microcoleaceae cyanobacterium]